MEYAKLVMSKFHYDVIKPIFGDKLKLLYTDTDSMYYEIRWPTDLNEYLAASVRANIFDSPEIPASSTVAETITRSG